ncbi:hypothetical protein [Salinicoccus roseus]|uniref:hypothetical protein n=1 Tax=Salinicoccus roseus TaxID=45670 RepID=UPI001EF6A7A9|nr:hypothetical protein [Salinicoccus roseus]MCG7332636.1 hypothetical protein [Salinicoccus roseus]
MNENIACDINPVTYIGHERGLTPYSEFPLKWYQSQHQVRQTLNASEYYAVTQGYLRESVCMGQCNMYIQVAQDPFIKKAIEIYRQDVCEPNLTELMVILKNGDINYRQNIMRSRPLIMFRNLATSTHPRLMTSKFL